MAINFRDRIQSQRPTQRIDPARTRRPVQGVSDPNAPGNVRSRNNMYQQGNNFGGITAQQYNDRGFGTGALTGGGAAGGTMGGFAGGGGAGGNIDIMGLINRQYDENREARDFTIDRSDEQNQMLEGLLPGSGPESLNQASSLINATSNMQGEAARYNAERSGQMGGSGAAAGQEQVEAGRRASLGQAAGDDAQRRLQEQLGIINSRIIPNPEAMDMSGLGSLLGSQMQANALGGGLAALGAGLSSQNQQTSQQQYAGIPGLGQAQNYGGLNTNMPLSAGLAISQGRSPMVMNNNDPMLQSLNTLLSNRQGPRADGPSTAAGFGWRGGGELPGTGYGGMGGGMGGMAMSNQQRSVDDYVTRNRPGWTPPSFNFTSGR